MNWDALLAISQGLVYVATATLIGGSFSHWLCLRVFPAASPQVNAWHRRMITAGALLGLVFAVIGYLSFIAGINDSGWRGAFDFELMSFFIFDPPSLVVMAQILLFPVIALVWRWSNKPVGQAILILSLVLIAWSFTLRGHLAQAPVSVQLLLTLHVIAMALWGGALLPLWLAVQQPVSAATTKLLESFGRIAQIFVAILLGSGLVMAFYLLQNLAEFWQSRYGLTLTAKLVVVSLLLLLAAINKFVLVPRLPTAHAQRWLTRTIYAEMLLVMVVFALTAVFTVVIGY